jgi:hypothetical protein
MIPGVGGDAFPRLAPEQPCSHASVSVNASGAMLDVAVDVCRGIFCHRVESAGYTNLVMGVDIYNLTSGPMNTVELILIAWWFFFAVGLSC